jgi:hypothetical protein
MVWQPECYSTNERWDKSKNCEEFEMAIQKKSLISNRTATKKALVAKPGVASVAPTRLKVADSRVKVADSRVRIADSRMKIADSRMKIADSRVRIADSRVRIAD